ncbi:hypothetical protein BGZ75_010326, partial [Mortierella antarctica]
MQGATLNVITHDDHTLTVEAPQCIDCRATIDIPIHQFHDDLFNLEAPYGPTLEDTVHEIKDAASGRNTTCPSASILQIKDARGTKMSAKISLGKEHSTGQGFYLQESSQIFIRSSCFLHVWNLSTTGRSICELAYIWKLDPDDESKHSGEYNPRTLLAAKMCEHGKNVRISLSAARWFHHSKRLPEGVLGKIDIVTTPISSKDTLKMTMDMRLAGGLQYLGTIHANSGPSVRESVQRYLDRSLNKHPESSLKSLCHAWSHENRTWLEKPKVIELVKTITDYCTHHATRTKDPGFLAPIIASMPQLMKHFPDYASVILTKVSYIPTKQRAFILHNHIVAYPPKVFLKFWKSKKKSLAKTKHPTLQLNDFLSKPNHKNNKFRRPLYIASFNMLWNYNDKTISEMSGPNDSTWRWRTWRTWYHMFTLKLRLRTHKYVECHDFNLEVFDNPAIRALVKYKWNTIGFRYWSFRFTFQLIFYILVIVAALLQVFRHELYTAHVTAVFISIIVFGVIFLWLELLQAIKHGKRYRTIYNLLDILGYTVPVCTSIQQMLVLRENNPNGYTKTLSFAVLIVFLHALFELRVFKSVCKYVSIIQHTVVEIRAFFFIFAAGIIAFAIATLHLLRACPVLDGCKELTIKFSGNFFGALSTTYFFMGGRYDDVAEDFDSDGWEFHLMMAIYLFFTVIVMLNVLIALINVAFTKGDDSWRLVCIESRLRYIESAENMSYHIPGFRQSYNWFPKEIFYSATPKEVKAYREKYGSKTLKNRSLNIKDYLEKDDYDDEEEHQGGARTRKPEFFQDEGNATSASFKGETEETKGEDQKDQVGVENEDGSGGDGQDDNSNNEEFLDVDEVEEEQAEDQDEDEAEDASVVRDLKIEMTSKGMGYDSAIAQRSKRHAAMDSSNLNVMHATENHLGPDMTSMGENAAASGPVLLASYKPVHEKEAMHSPHSVFRRWYFNGEQDEIGTAESYMRSSLVKTTEPWECERSLRNVTVGWYSLVFCVSLDKLNVDLLESITFDVKLCGREHRDMEDTGAKTVVSNEEMKHLPRTGRTLLRLHRQSYISDSSKYLNPIVTIKTTAEPVTPQSMELHYIELTTESIQPSAGAEGTVHPLYGEDKPDQFIKVGDSSKYPVKICAYAVSDMGTYVATLYRIHKTVHLDIWNIQKQDDDSRTTPYAQQSFQLEDGHEYAHLTYEVAISSTGLQAAVCSLDEMGAFGYIAFRTIDSAIGPEDIETKNERFF